MELPFAHRPLSQSREQLVHLGSRGTSKAVRHISQFTVILPEIVITGARLSIPQDAWRRSLILTVHPSGARETE